MCTASTKQLRLASTHPGGLLVRTRCGRNEPATLCRFFQIAESPAGAGASESGPTWI